jgi:hypothetical protein
VSPLARHAFSAFQGSAFALRHFKPLVYLHQVKMASDRESDTDDEPEPVNALSALGELRQELQGELEGLVQERSRRENELQALNKEIEHKQSVLELVKAAEERLTGQGSGQPQPDLKGGKAGASRQVRDSAR